MDILVTDLHWAVRSNEVGIIKSLLAKGSPIHSIDSVGRTPLHWAIVSGHEKAFQALILNISRHLIDMKDKLGRTPLHYACAADKTDFASILIKRGASVNARDSKGRTPLHYAAQNMKSDMAQLLIGRGANKDVGDCNGVKPWDLALKWGCPHGFEVLRVDSVQLISFRDPTTEDSHVEMNMNREISDDSGRGVAEILKPNPHAEKPSSLDLLLCEWKKAEEEVRKKKKGATDGLIEALKAWRESETEAKLEKQRKLIHQSAHFKNQLSSCSSAIPLGILYKRGGEAIEKKDDSGWGCTEWESPLRVQGMRMGTSEVEKWEKVMEWRFGSGKEPWASRRDQAPGSPIEAV